MAAKQWFLEYYSEWRCSQDQGECPPYRQGGRSSGVVVKRGSTVVLHAYNGIDMQQWRKTSQLHANIQLQSNLLLQVVKSTLHTLLRFSKGSCLL